MAESQRVLVVFKVDEEHFGVPIEQVKEINRLVEITSVPNSPPGVLGVMNLRGKVIPVLSLRERFGLAGAEADDATRIVVSEVHGQLAGFVVDTVTEVLRLDEDAIEAPPTTAAFVDGIGKVGDRLVLILDLERVSGLAAMEQLAC